MTFNLTVNEAAGNSGDQIDMAGVATHNVLIKINQTDAGLLSGPFTLSGARAFAEAAISRTNVIQVTIVPIS